MKKDITLDDLKNVIRKFGFEVSEIEPKGPVHMLFLEQFEKIYLCKYLDLDEPPIDITNEHKFEKYVIEYETMLFKDLEEFENNLKPMHYRVINKIDYAKLPIFSFYTLNRVSDGYRVRLGWLDNYYGIMKEISKERAKEILSKRENSKHKVSLEFYEDLKIVYDL